MIRGYGYMGSDSIKTSTANLQLVPDKKYFIKFDFFNYQQCVVKINNSSNIFLNAEQGFSADEVDQPITSFIIVTAGVPYNWIGSLGNY